MAMEQALIAEQDSQDQQGAGGGAEVSFVISLGASYLNASPEQLSTVLPWLRAVTNSSAQQVFVGYPVTHGGAVLEQREEFLLQPFQSSIASSDTLVHTAAAWMNAFELVRAHGARCCLLLGGEAESLDPALTASLLNLACEKGADLAVPRYDLPTNQGLLNAAVLSPLSRAVFNADVYFPLSLDVACSARMAERMAGAAQRFTANSQAEAVVWPVGEAAVAGYTIAEAYVGTRAIPQTDQDLGTILGRVAGSMFADVEAKATFWQRTRPATPVLRSDTAAASLPAGSEPPSADELQSLVESFRVGYSNLHEIWSLVLPPNTLVALKRLSVAPVESFQLPDSTWIRIVYDFVLAHRLRTIARNHLMGAFAPLYLAWVASHLAQNQGQAHMESLSRAFEADKPYLVSRWRWPDRFNP